jgi:NADPH-ferrihemoprotein reductase
MDLNQQLGIGLLVGVGVGIIAYVRGTTSTKENDARSETTATDSSNSPYPYGPLLIYFGSQTGTAEGFARTLMEEGRDIGFDTTSLDLEDFNADALCEAKNAIFLMATYGEGEPTDNAVDFSSWVENKENNLAADHLKGVRFSVFGLGNRQYEHYNRMGKLTDKRLSALGAQRSYDLGEGDDDGTLEEDFDSWKADLWPAMLSAMGASESESRQRTASTESNGRGRSGSLHRVTLTYAAEPCACAPAADVPPDQQVSSTRHYFTSPKAHISVNRELRPGNASGSTRHIEVELAGTGLEYQTADTLCVLPENETGAVLAVASTLAYDLDSYVRLVPVQGQRFKNSFPSPCSVRDILSKYLDIQGIVRHGAAERLLPYISQPSQAQWLQNLLLPTNRGLFKKTIEDRFRCLADLIAPGAELSSANIPLSDLLHLVPHLQPRYYTISSSNLSFPDVVSITVSVTAFAVTPDLQGGAEQPNKPRQFKGVASNYLMGLRPGHSCRIFIRPSTFKLPAALETPVVMIGPGTGVAPMRALLQEREFRFKETHSLVSAQQPTNILYFGCQRQDCDYIYREELESYQKEGTLTKLSLAFSRAQTSKVYVQHLLSEERNAVELVRMLDVGAHIYVCGATAMGNDVLQCVSNILTQHKFGGDVDRGSEEVKALQKAGRYIQELWST